MTIKRRVTQMIRAASFIVKAGGAEYIFFVWKYIQKKNIFYMK